MNLSELKELNKETIDTLTEPYQPQLIGVKLEQWNALVRHTTMVGTEIVKNTDLISKLPTQQGLDDLMEDTVTHHLCDEGNNARSDSENEPYHGISNPDSQQFTDQYDNEIEFGYSGTNEDEGFDTVENKSEVGVDWGNVALGAIALGAAIETMVNSNDSGRKKKNHAPKTESRDKKKRHNHDHGYDLGL